MDSRPIGFMDSGVGGVFVMRQAQRLLPREDFLFFGDLGHAPYGNHTRPEIRAIAMNAARHLLSQKYRGGLQYLLLRY